VEAGMPLAEVAGHFREVTPTGAPGSTYSYQNAMFALSGEMMLRATGQNIEKLLAERLFKPLEMCSVSMDYETLSKTANVAAPHVKWRKGYKAKKLNHSYYNAVAAGGINANAHDMARWMRFLLGHNPEVMDSQALQAAFTPVIEIKGRAKYYHRWPGHIASYYGYGWRIHHFEEERGGPRTTMWHHGGSVNDFRNEIALFPEADLGICVLLNSNSSLAKRVIPELYEIVQSVYSQPAEHLALNSLTDASDAR
jgi:beta-lactamase class C